MPRIASTACTLALLALGCQGADATFATPAPDAGPDGGVGDAPPRGVGYFAHRRGLVRPHCLGVVLAPDRVLATRACLDDTAISALRFTAGGAPPAAVDRRLEGGPKGPTVRLALASPLEEARDAALGAMPAVGARVEATTFRVTAPEDGPPPPTDWTAEVVEVREETFVAELATGAPTCHGDLGAAALLDGRVRGMLVAVERGGPEHPASPRCATRYVFAGLR
ncbi:MAG TPA: hypothetical protein RMH99_30185 [Sandaracinaceae bacterium LLY-WYZ-13_1]|nr:hypothetical protein [Sandaracinaceae bacterium LLY-WYZ-13_1]